MCCEHVHAIAHLDVRPDRVEELGSLVLSALLAGVAIKSFGHASSSAPTRHANAIPTRADAAEPRTQR
jgi:hypothetical protein